MHIQQLSTRYVRIKILHIPCDNGRSVIHRDRTIGLD